jgi:predicted nucleic acid binding AN1-type Zn finger protein
MACENCKKKCGIPINCLYCNGNFCPRCTHLERHGCRGIEIKKEKDLKELQKRNIFDKEPKFTKI